MLSWLATGGCSVQKEGWDMVAEKCLFYKLLQRRTMLLYSKRGWWWNKAVWMICLWVVVSVLVGYEGKPKSKSTPVFVGITGFQIMWAYKVVLEARQKLIPLGCIFEAHEEQEVRLILGFLSITTHLSAYIGRSKQLNETVLLWVLTASAFGCTCATCGSFQVYNAGVVGACQKTMVAAADYCA